MPEPDRETLASKFYYKPSEGTLINKSTNKPMGSKCARGYLTVNVGGKNYYNHRLIFKLVTGFDAVVIDHKNGNVADNRWDNLRHCNQSKNLFNKNKQSNNTSGYKGVVFHKKNGKFYFQVSIRGRRTTVHGFETALEAAKARDACAMRLHGEFFKGDSKID